MRACMLRPWWCPSLLRSHEPEEPVRLLSPWNSPGKNTGAGCHFPHQGIFPTQGSNPCLLCLLGRQLDSLPLAPSGKPILLDAAAAAKSLHSCPTLCDPIDGSPPGSSILGILQARTLEWVAISFSILLDSDCLYGGDQDGCIHA